jgi:glycerol-3-phosphate dehydrogenase subunit B
MMTDLIVIGAGLTGLFASELAAARGASVTLVSLGRGGLSLGHGCIDAKLPRPSSSSDSPPHPLHMAGEQRLRAGCDSLLMRLTGEGLHYAGRLDGSVETLTPLGQLRSTQFAPTSMALPQIAFEGRVAIAGILGFRDFMPALTVRGLKHKTQTIDCLDGLPWPGEPPRRDQYAPDLARSLVSGEDLARLCELWRPLVSGYDVLGVPAILGMTNHHEIWSELQSALGVQVFEIPTLPPSVPGLRLEIGLRRAALAAGVRVIDGAKALGQLDVRGPQRRVVGVAVETAGGMRNLPADHVLLATGGILNGGIQSDQAGTVTEPVFGTPVGASRPRPEWVGLSPGEPQAYARYGVRVNDRMQALDAAGEIFAIGLHAAGGVVSGPDRSLSACRQGIDIATAYRAIEAILA